MEEAWNHATESNAVPPSDELSLPPQLYFPESTLASISSVPALVDLTLTLISSILWRQIGSRSAFKIGSNHFKPLSSRAILLEDLE